MRRDRFAIVLFSILILVTAARLPASVARGVFNSRDFNAVLEVQVLLDRAGFSPGLIDGAWGRNSRVAVRWYRVAQGLPPGFAVTRAVLERLRTPGAPPLAHYTVVESDLAGPFTDIPDDVSEKAKLPCLCYRSPAEELGERFHTSPEALARLNPGINVDSLAAGNDLVVPNVFTLRDNPEAARDARVEKLVISKRGFYTLALGPNNAILYFFPSTVGSGFNPSPDQTLQITGISPKPTYTYDPKLLGDVPQTDPVVELPAGPNSPVGVVWIDLSAPHYGIHGTDEPSTIGHTVSHGCVRLTNWDAEFLSALVRRGMPVEFRDFASR